MCSFREDPGGREIGLGQERKDGGSDFQLLEIFNKILLDSISSWEAEKACRGLGGVNGRREEGELLLVPQRYPQKRIETQLIHSYEISPLL